MQIVAPMPFVIFLRRLGDNQVKIGRVVPKSNKSTYKYKKYPQVLKITQMYPKLPKSTQKYPKVPKSSQQYPKLAKSSQK